MKSKFWRAFKVGRSGNGNGSLRTDPSEFLRCFGGSVTGGYTNFWDRDKQVHEPSLWILLTSNNLIFTYLILLITMMSRFILFHLPQNQSPIPLNRISRSFRAQKEKRKKEKETRKKKKELSKSFSPRFRVTPRTHARKASKNPTPFSILFFAAPPFHEHTLKPYIFSEISLKNSPCPQIPKHDMTSCPWNF